MQAIKTKDTKGNIRHFIKQQTIHNKNVDRKEEASVKSNPQVQATISIDESVLGEDGELSLEKFSPITYDTVHFGYYRLGEKVGNAFKDGAALK